MRIALCDDAVHLFVCLSVAKTCTQKCDILKKALSAMVSIFSLLTTSIGTTT